MSDSVNVIRNNIDVQAIANVTQATDNGTANFVRSDL